MTSILPLPLIQLPSSELHEKLPQIFDQFGIFVLSNEPIEKLSELDLPASGVLLFTSGSSGKKKGVYFSFEQLKHAAQKSVDFYQINSSDIIIGALPLYHMGGLMSYVRSLVANCSFHYVEPSKIQDDIERYHATIISLVPAQLSRCLENPKAVAALKKMKAIIIGGEAPSQSLIKKSLELKLPISTSFGATETAGQITANSPGSELNMHGFGFPLGDTKIFSLESSTLIQATTLADALIIDGEVIPVRGEIVLNDVTSFDYKVGLSVHGRSDQLFKSGAKFVDPFKISQYLKNEFQFFECFILPIPDQQWGNTVGLLYYRDHALTEKEIIKINQSLSTHERPKKIIKLAPLQSGIKRNRQELINSLMSEHES